MPTAEEGHREHGDRWEMALNCRTCGERWWTGNMVVYDHWLQFGCPACQRRYNDIAQRLLERAFSLEEWNDLWH